MQHNLARCGARPDDGHGRWPPCHSGTRPDNSQYPNDGHAGRSRPSTTVLKRRCSRESNMGLTVTGRTTLSRRTMNRGCERSGSLIPANVPGALPHRYGAVCADSSILSNNVRPRLPSVRTRCADLNFDPMHLSPPCHPRNPIMLTRKPLRAAATATRVDQSNHALSRDPAPCGGSCAKARTWTYRPDNVRTDPEVSFALLSSTRPDPDPPTPTSYCMR